MLKSETVSSPWFLTRVPRYGDRAWYVGLTLVALAIRLGYVLAAGKTQLVWGDEFAYDQLAVNLLRYGCYCFLAGVDSVFRAPLYPYLLAGMYALIGRNFLAVVVLQAFFGALTVPLVIWLGKQISQRAQVGLVAGVLTALNPILIFATALLYTETLFIFILTLLACGLQLLGVITRFRYWLAIALGILLAAANLLRPTLQLLPIFLFGWAVLSVPKLKDGVRLVTVLTLAMTLMMVPWAVRNYQVTGDFVTVSVNGGINLLQGNYDGADGGAMKMADLPPLPGMTEKQRDDAYWQLGVDWIKANPIGFVKLAPLKLGMFFSPVEASNQGRLFGELAPFLIGIAAVYYLVGLLGVAFSLRDWRRWLLPFILIVYPAALAVVFSGGTRYGMVTQPFVALFVALAVCVLFEKTRQSRSLRVRIAEGG